MNGYGLQTLDRSDIALAPIQSLETYLAAVMSGLRTQNGCGEPSCQESSDPEAVFDVLTSREFCYLSKARVDIYKQSILKLIGNAISKSQPIPFYFDIGGGYHASVRPGEQALNFDVGLAELFVLSQISAFADRIGRFYTPGVRFSLVIDNLCALLINDVPLKNTERYCARLRQLISEVQLGHLIDLLVESEHFSPADVSRLAGATSIECRPILLTCKQRENVERFLGRPCDESEALKRFLRYQEIIDASESLLASLIRGVHMTQRATDTTICFRPFPGGDSRIQCGEVALGWNNKNRLYPIFLTSSNIGEYRMARFRLPDILPAAIPYVSYVERMVL